MTELSPELIKELKDASDALGKSFEEFKEANDQNLSQRDVVLEEKLAKINEAMDNCSEDLNQKLTALEQERKKLAETSEEMAAEQTKSQERIAELETALARKPVGQSPDEEKHEVFENWARATVKSAVYGRDSLQAKESAALLEEKALSVADDSTGGFLAPNEYVNEILKGVVEMSPMRTITSVRSTSNRAIMIPKRTQTGAAAWVSELGNRSETQNPTFGMEEIPTHEMYALIDISEQNLEDSAFNLEQFIRDESTEQFAVTEGLAFVTGNAVGKPEGVLDNSDVGETVSGSAATIADSSGQANGMIDLYHDLKTAYARNATWILNRSTLGEVRKLKDGNNNYIWQNGLADLRPNTILGQPYVEMPDMPDQAANAYPVMFGDFRRGYIVVDRISMSILRDIYTQATGGLIRFIFRRRVGGQVVISEALRKLKCST